MEDSNTKEDMNNSGESASGTSESTNPINAALIAVPVDSDNPTSHPLFNTFVDIWVANMQFAKSLKDLELKRVAYANTEKQDQLISEIKSKLEHAKQCTINLNQRIQDGEIAQERLNHKKNNLLKYAKDLDAVAVTLLESTAETENKDSLLIKKPSNEMSDQLQSALEEKTEYIKNKEIELGEQKVLMLQYENEMKTKDNELEKINSENAAMLKLLENSTSFQNTEKFETQSNMEKKSLNKQNYSNLMNKLKELEDYNKNLMDKFDKNTEAEERLLLDVEGTRRELKNSENELNDINRAIEEGESIKVDNHRRPESEKSVSSYGNTTKMPLMFFNRNRPKYNIKNTSMVAYEYSEKVSSSTTTILAGISTAANTVTSFSMCSEEIPSSTDKDETINLC